MKLINFLFVGLFLVVVLLILNSFANSHVITSNVVFGNITDFEVSAGGFMHVDMCKIQINNTIEMVASGFVCHDLQTGKLLEKINYKTGEIYYRMIE